MTDIDIKMDHQTLREYIGRTTESPQSPNLQPPKYTTIIFEDRDEYIRFYDEVFAQFGGKGLRFTNVPIPQTTRVAPWLLEQTKKQFNYRPVTKEDIDKAAKRLEGRKPFDPANIDYFLPAPKPRTP